MSPAAEFRWASIPLFVIPEGNLRLLESPTLYELRRSDPDRDALPLQGNDRIHRVYVCTNNRHIG